MNNINTILVGSGKADITPPTGWPLQGFGPDYGVSTGIHDPLFARAVALRNARVAAAIVAVDVCGMPLKDCRSAAEAASVLTGIPAENINICASHNHHSPGIANLFTANRAPSDEYIQKLRAGIVEAVCQANARPEPAFASSARAELALNLNRRVEMPDGTVKDLPWNRHLKPNGPVDSELIAVRFSDMSGKRTIALLYNYASHAICLGEHIKQTSADFPGAASAFLESRFGGVALFLNGACGNIHPVNFSKGYPEMEAMGKAIKDEVVSAFPHGAAPGPVSALSCASRMARIPIKLEAAEKLRTEHLEAGRFDAGSGTIVGPVRAIRMGEIGIVFVPCEYFTEFGLEIKRDSPFSTTLVVSVANDYLDYAPTPEQYAKGGYEVQSTVFTEQSGRIITDSALELLGRIR